MNKIKIKKFSMFLIVLTIISFTDVSAVDQCCLNPNAGTTYYCTDARQDFCCPNPLVFPGYYGGNGPSNQADCQNNFYNFVACPTGAGDTCEIGCCCDPYGNAVAPGQPTYNALCDYPPNTFAGVYSYPINWITYNTCQAFCSDTFGSTSTTTTTISGTTTTITPTTTTTPTTTSTTGTTSTSTIGTTTTSTTIIPTTTIPVSDCIDALPAPSPHSISHIKGKEELKLIWYVVEGADSYVLYKCKGDCVIPSLEGYLLETVDAGVYCDTSFCIFVDDEVAWGNLYEYSVAASKEGVLSDFGDWQTGENPGDAACEGIFDEYEICSLDHYYHCNNKNKVANEQDCSGGTSCVTSGEYAWCRSDDELCNYGGQDGTPFDMYFTGVGAQYTYYDFSETTKDSCYNCKGVRHCYDYRSKDACNNDDCIVGMGDGEECIWRDYEDSPAYIDDMNNGVCVNKKEDNCEFCSKASYTDYTNQNEIPGSGYALNVIFDVCTEEKAHILSTTLDGSIPVYPIEKCQFISVYDEGEAKSCEKMTCYDYGVSGIPPETECQEDICDLGVCKKGSNKCFKDANDDYNDDCSLNNWDCYKDMDPPRVILNIPKNVLDGHGIIYLTSVDAENIEAKLCVDQINDCLAEEGVLISDDNSHVIEITLAGEGTVLADANNIGNLANGINYLRYYVIDDYDNPSIGSFEFTVDTGFQTQPHPPYGIFLALNEQIVGTNSGTKLNLIVGVDEMARCDFTFRQGSNTLGTKTHECFSMEFDLRSYGFFDDLVDGFYELDVICEDLVGWTSSDTFYFPIDNDNTVSKILPESIYNDYEPDVGVDVTSGGYDCEFYLDGVGLVYTSIDGVLNTGTGRYDHIFPANHISYVVNEGRNDYSVDCSNPPFDAPSETFYFIYDVLKPTIFANDKDDSTGENTFDFNLPYPIGTALALRCKDYPRDIDDKSIGFGCKPYYCVDDVECTPEDPGTLPETIDGDDSWFNVPPLTETKIICYQAVENIKDGMGGKKSDDPSQPGTEDPYCETVNIDAEPPIFAFIWDYANSGPIITIWENNWPITTITTGTYKFWIEAPADFNPHATISLTDNNGNEHTYEFVDEDYDPTTRRYAVTLDIHLKSATEVQVTLMTRGVARLLNINLPNNILKLQILGYDIAGNSGTKFLYETKVFNSLEFPVDITPPSAPSITDVYAGARHWSSNKLYIKTGEDVVVEGTFDSTDVDELFLYISEDDILDRNSDIEIVNPTTNNNDFTFNIVNSDFAIDRMYYLFVVAEDGVDNSAQASQVPQIIKDTLSPFVQSRVPQGTTGPIDGNVELEALIEEDVSLTTDVSGINEETIKLKIYDVTNGVYIDDSDGDQYVDNINNLLCAPPTIPLTCSVKHSFAFSGAGITDYTATVEAEDNIGNYVQETWSFTIDPSLPAGPTWSPSPPFGPGTDKNYISSLTPAITVTFAEPDTLITGIELNGIIPRINLNNIQTYTYTIPAGSLTNGQQYTLTVFARKNLGGNPPVYGSENGYPLTFYVDTTKPELTDISIVELSNGNYRIRGDFTEENIYSIKVNNVDATINTGYFISSELPPDVFSSDVMINLNDKANNLQVITIQKDSSVFTLDPIPQYTPTASLGVTGTGVPSSKVKIKTRRAPIVVPVDTLTNLYDGTFSGTLTLAEGKNRFVAYNLVDTDGDINIDNIFIRMVDVVLDKLKPIVDSEIPTGTTSNSHPTISIRFVDDTSLTTDVSGINLNAGTLYFDTVDRFGGGYAYSIPVSGSSPFNYDNTNNILSYDLTGYPYLIGGNLQDDNYKVKFEDLQDNAGNSINKEWLFTVDTSLPEPTDIIVQGDVSIMPPDVYVNLFSNDLKIIYGSVTCVNSVEMGKSPFAYIPLNLNSNTGDKIFTYTIDPSLMTDTNDPYILYVKITASKRFGASCGEQGTFEKTFYVKHLDPIATITTPAPGAATGQQTIAVEGTYTNGPIQEIKIQVFDSNNVQVGSDVSATILTDSYIASVNLGSSDGQYKIKVIPTDKAGNIGSSVTRNVVLDTTSPTITDDYAYDGQWVDFYPVVKLTPDDGSGSGIKEVKYCAESACDPSLGNVLSWPYELTFNAAQNKIIRYQAWDNVDNPSNIGTFNVKIDTLPPSIFANTVDDLTGQNTFDFTKTYQAGTKVTIVCIDNLAYNPTTTTTTTPSTTTTIGTTTTTIPGTTTTAPSTTTTIPGGYGVYRTFSSNTVLPNQIVTVTLDVVITNPLTQTYYLIEEYVPSNWQVIDDGGGGTPVQNSLKWAVIQGVTSKTYTYTAKAPSIAGTYYFTGSYFIEGMASPQGIGGQTQIDVSTTTTSTIVSTTTTSTTTPTTTIPSTTTLPTTTTIVTTTIPTTTTTVVACAYCGDTAPCLPAQSCDNSPGVCIDLLGQGQSDCDCDQNCQSGLHCSQVVVGPDYCCPVGTEWDGSQCS